MSDHAEIIYYKGNAANVEIPFAMGGKPVTVVGSGSFFDKPSLRSVTIPSSVKKIDRNAFSWCVNLEEVELSKGLEVIGSEAFCGTDSLVSIVVPDGVTSIGDSVFNVFDHQVTNLTSVTLPASVIHMGDNVFGGCTNVTVYAPAGSYAQEWCNDYGVPFEAH